MKKNIQVIGYQSDTLCTRADLEKFDTIWWASRPVAKVVYDYRPLKFKLSDVAKHVFSRGVYWVKALPKL